MKIFVLRIYYTVYCIVVVFYKVISYPFDVVIRPLWYGIVSICPFFQRLIIRNYGSVGNYKRYLSHFSNLYTYDLNIGIAISKANFLMTTLLIMLFYDVLFLMFLAFNWYSLYSLLRESPFFSFMVIAFLAVLIAYFFDKGEYNTYFKVFRRQKRNINIKWHVLSLSIMSFITCLYILSMIVFYKVMRDNMSSYEAIRYVMNKYL